MEDRGKIEPMLKIILNRELTMHMRALNHRVRYTVMQYVYRFFTIFPEDAEEMTTVVLEHLNDESVEIRSQAMMQCMICVDQCWRLLSKREFIQPIFAKIIDEMSRDRSPKVRAAVYKALRPLLTNAAAMNVVEHALKCVVPHGLADRSEKVRLACFQFLNLIRDHRFIRFYDVADVSLILACAELETDKKVQEQIVGLIQKLQAIAPPCELGGTSQEIDTESNCELFAKLIAQTTKDIEILIDTFPSEGVSTAEINEQMVRKDHDKMKLMRELEASVDDAERLSKSLEQKLSKIAQVQVDSWNQGKTLLHCSAGIGRTGTLLVIDWLLCNLYNGGCSDVTQLVKLLRSQRAHSIQTDRQYIFIHSTVLDYLCTKYPQRYAAWGADTFLAEAKKMNRSREPAATGPSSKEPTPEIPKEMKA
ncbi:unnamed protein product, partial [Mesorhabditis spiculigera]